MDSFLMAELIIILLHVLVKTWEQNPKLKKTGRSRSEGVDFAKP